MLKNLLNEVEQTINSMEHQQRDKDNFYRNIDGLVERLMNEKLEGKYFVYQARSFKGTDSVRSVNIFQGRPDEEEYYWQWGKNKPSITIWYKIKLEVCNKYSSYKQYNLKQFSIITEYNDYEFELSNKFKEMNESCLIHLEKRKQELIKSKGEFIIFLESLKQSIVDSEDIAITRKESNYSWMDGVKESKEKFEKFISNYAELMKMDKPEQE